MRNLRTAVAFAAVIGLLALPSAWADLSVKDGGGTTRTIYNFVCQTTKLCNATALIATDGTAIGVGAGTATASLRVTQASDSPAATAALQTTGNSTLSTMNTALSTINTTLGTPFQAGGSIGNTAFGATQSGAWDITNISGTISLPTLASTSTKQSDGSQKTQIVDGSGNVIAATSNNLNVQCANCSGSGVSTADAASFTASTSLFAGTGGFFQTTATSNPLTNGQQGMLQMTANRAAFTNLRNASGTELGVAAAPLQVSLANTAANSTAVKVDGSAVTQPVSGTVTANLGTIGGAATETTLAALNTKTPALGQALAAASVPVILPSATITTLTPPAAITGFATETTLAALNTKTPALGQALAAASVPVILPSATITTLTPPAAITGFATAVKQPALGTAGSASTDVLTVQGIASMTPFLSNPGTAANWGVGATAATIPANANYVGMVQGGNLVGMTGTSGNLNVQCANCSGSGVSTTDAATFTASTSLFAGTGGFYQTTATSNALTNGQQGMWQMTANRAGFVNLRNAAGAEMGVAGAEVFVGGRGAAGTPAGGVLSVQGVASGTAMPVSGTFWQATQPVSGTVTANLGTIGGAATETTLAALNTKFPAQGQALAAASIPVILPSATITTLTPPAAITGFATETTLAAINTKTPALGQALAAASVPVILPSATVTTLTPPAAITGFGTSANQSTAITALGTINTTLGTVIGTKNAGTAATNAQLAALVYNSTPLTLTTTQQASLQGDANGYLKVNVAAGGTGAITAASGAYASGSISSGAYAAGALAAGALATGAGVDGWDVTTGAKADSVCGTATGTCSVVALLKYLNNTAGSAIPAGAALIGDVNLRQGGTALSATNGIFTNLLLGNAVLSATNGLFANQLQGNAVLSISNPSFTRTVAGATGGATPTGNIAANNTTAVVIKASAGTLYSAQLSTIGSVPLYLKIYNATSATCGSGTPVKRLIIPKAGTAADGGGSIISFGPTGVNFSTGITYCITGGIADNDTTAPAASVALVNLDWN